MDGRLVEPDTAEFRVVEKDPQFTENISRINRKSGNTEGNYLQIANDAVSCTGSKDSLETKFKVHIYADPSGERYALFECIGGKNKNWMLCVNPQLQLSARKKTKDYINFEDAEDDVVFSIVRAENYDIQIKWKKGGQYIGFDKKGQPKALGKDNEKERFLPVPV